MSNYKSYPAYKDSGADWLGDIPENWKAQRTKTIFKLITEPAPKNNNEELLSVYTDIGVKPRRELEERGNKASTTDNYWKVKKGDIIVNKLLAWMGAIGISDYEGVTSPAYDILRKRIDIEPIFYNYLFRNITIRNELKRYSKGIMDMRLRLYFDEFGQIFLPLPPKPEQTAIAQFLDRKTAEIKAFIALKEKTIALLKELKTAIINQAVTKGLDPNVEMKDSGIEWLGEIPKHWDVKKLKYLLKCKLKYGANESAELDNKEYPRYIRITDFGNDGKLKKDTFKSLLPKVAAEYLLKEGDILFARSGGTVGKTFQFKDYGGQACFAGYLIKAEVNEKLFSDYLYTYTKSGVYEKWKDSIFNQATIQNIGADKYSILPVTQPPKKEQKLILEFVNVKSHEIDRSISQAEKEIALIREYQQSLISDAVAGKIDVRGWNAFGSTPENLSLAAEPTETYK
ncbi:restriction endonuclease subunit S [Reichenbachiella sp. MSK19-1]|uniref:restriction endonuclease subunit S n=1 Tax=Reichenbachiella sp. MSK19-1 TaxID=1897631 RepID=UPI000E6C1C82|nr:restriction endonuclease subunit S [Reichenbachiella sp. MSK19-1]RJE74958.1 hypothetical protein BGP76_17720 [Reichenbachiella sp. MSK19-1]